MLLCVIDLICIVCVFVCKIKALATILLEMYCVCVRYVLLCMYVCIMYYVCMYYVLCMYVLCILMRHKM
jgi:hypothetical protein